MKKIQEIRAEFEESREESWPSLCEKYKDDGRKGVAALVTRCQRKMEALEAERQRMYGMFAYEREYEHLGYICGIDEAGRGPLAGPVVAGAVILQKNCGILYLNDSKKLSAARREELYRQIVEEAVAVGVGYASPQRIDEINILQATYEAMREAIQKLKIKPQILLNDAVTIPGVSCIAAASIVAKVTRDRLMVEYDRLMPEYGFASHKGYGAAAHIEALKKYGPSPIHRKSFITHFI